MNGWAMSENHTKPRVGIPWRTTEEEGKKIHPKLDYYFHAVERAGAEPVGVSLAQAPEQLQDQLQNLDGFVLPGSRADVEPALYHAARNEKTQDADSNREKTDFAILKHALASRKPVLAICYGCQLLNVALGGSLYQDLASELHTNIRHSRDGLQTGAPDPVHPARMEPEGEIAQLAAACGIENRDGGFVAEVNTSHHQSIRDLGHGLRLAAVAPDGVIEAVEHDPHEHWVVGVQWHPERMPSDPLAVALFRALVQATRATAGHR